MSATTTPPIPRQPLGTTFIVSICVLGAIAMLQLAAVIIPLVRQQIVQQAAQMSANVPEQAVSSPVVASAPSQTTDAAEPSPAIREQVAGLFAEAEKFGRLGQYDESLKKLDEIAAILPGDPYELFLRGQILERMGKPADAAMAIESALQVPGFPAAYRKQAEMKLELIRQAPGFSEQYERLQVQARPSVADVNAKPMVDNEGLQPGSTLGIVESKLRDVKNGVKSLRVAVKSRPGVKVVDPGVNVQVSVSFYEKTEDGEIVIYNPQILSQWISQPLDWAENMPEILDVQFPLPDEGRTYFGYTVGVYYNGELQDTRADPGSLDKQFPLPLYLKQ